MRKGGNVFTPKCTARNPHVLASLTVRRVEVRVSGLEKGIWYSQGVPVQRFSPHSGITLHLTSGLTPCVRSRMFSSMLRGRVTTRRLIPSHAFLV